MKLTGVWNSEKNTEILMKVWQNNIGLKSQWNNGSLKLLEITKVIKLSKDYNFLGIIKNRHEYINNANIFTK